MIQYHVIQLSCHSYVEVLDFEKEVREYLNNGWKLQGGVSIAHDSNGVTYLAQAVIREI